VHTPNMYPHIEPHMSYAAQSEWMQCKIDFLDDRLQRSNIAATREILIKKIAYCMNLRDHLMDLSTGMRSDPVIL